METEINPQVDSLDLEPHESAACAPVQHSSILERALAAILQSLIPIYELIRTEQRMTRPNSLIAQTIAYTADCDMDQKERKR